MHPMRVRNSSFFVSSKMSEPIIAAWLLPSPGRKLHSGAARREAKKGFFI